jgi:hypothetical protein
VLQTEAIFLVLTVVWIRSIIILGPRDRIWGWNVMDNVIYAAAAAAAVAFLLLFVMFV